MLVASLTAVGATYTGYALGWPTLATLALFPLGYVTIRTLLATIGRTRYWLERETRDVYARTCPKCGQYIYRMSGDWLLSCHRCDWRAGWPIIRWVTQTVPVRQLKRSASMGQLLEAIVAVIVIAASFGGSVPISSHGTSGGSNPMNDLFPTDAGTPDPTMQHGFSREIVEDEFIRFLNAERQRRGLQTLSERDVLTEMGQTHSQNMAEHQYLGHVEPDGDTIEDRYRERGLHPECRLPIDGSNQYYAGAENAAHTWVNERVRLDTGASIYVANETDLARVLFEMWMNSPPHRQAMLVTSADDVGLGLYIDGRRKVYASLELC